MKRLGILTSGGDAPGMNAAIRAVVRTAVGRGISVAGYVDGFSGYVAGQFSELDDRAVGNIIQRGGTIIGTSRCPEFLDPLVRTAAAMAASGATIVDVTAFALLSLAGVLYMHWLVRDPRSVPQESIHSIETA